MNPQTRDIEALERRFWDALVAQDAQAAIDLLTEPALMVGGHGAMRFDREQYRRMAEQGPMVVKSYDFSDVEVTFPTDDVAIVTYRVRQEMVRRGEERGAEQHMIDSSAWLRGATGEWKCAMHTETPAEAKAAK
jgi:uncharacterized protein (TIGR02246 family)